MPIEKKEEVRTILSGKLPYYLFDKTINAITEELTKNHGIDLPSSKTRVLKPYDMPEKREVNNN